MLDNTARGRISKRISELAQLHLLARLLGLWLGCGDLEGMGMKGDVSGKTGR